MKETIKITITGNSAAGKSAVMHVIYKLLEMVGFEVEIDLSNQFDYKSERDFLFKMMVNETSRIEGVKNKTKIVLEEVQAVRTLNFEKEEE